MQTRLIRIHTTLLDFQCFFSTSVNIDLQARKFLPGFCFHFIYTAMLNAFPHAVEILCIASSGKRFLTKEKGNI